MRSLPYLVRHSLAVAAAAWGATVLISACGGIAVVDPDGSASSSAGGTSSSASTGGGGRSCLDHTDCSDGELCLFSTGECAPACVVQSCGEPCDVGQVCNGCATSSCPDCKDCLSACLPAQPGQCDDHDDCAASEVCIFGASQCAPRCDAQLGCPGNLVCADCVTSSCPCCADCGSACVQDP